MKEGGFLSTILILLLMLTGCHKDEDESEITMSSDVGTVELYSVINQSKTITFTAEGNWEAYCSANWFTVSPRTGVAGTHTISIATTETNRTKTTRMAELSITTRNDRKTIHVKQRDEYAVFLEGDMIVPAEGTEFNISFLTNIASDKFELYSTEGLDEWIVSSDNKSRTRAEEKTYSLTTPLTVLANTTKDSREGAFFLVMKDADNNPMGLDTLYIRQEGVGDDYVSTDYSQDGQVEQLNKATIGRGIPIVLMGDAFVDRDIADSTYAKVMQKAMDNLFSEEPVKSLKEYFDVYAVTAVSSENVPDADHSTAMETEPELGTTTILVDTAQVKKYVKKVSGIDETRTLAVVILNSTQRKGVTYMYASEQDPTNYAIALCPTIDSLESETFREVLVHEAIGHGLAKLADEYVNSKYGSATDEDIRNLKHRQEKYGWALNIEAESDPTKVRWTTFITDSRYLAESVGVYEGGYTFYKGVYRPTEESMMRQNDSPFNAPSRQVIYNKVMQLALDRTPTLDEFIEFDQLHQPTKWYYHSRQTRSGEQNVWHLSHPVVIWR